MKSRCQQLLLEVVLKRYLYYARCHGRCSNFAEIRTGRRYVRSWIAEAWVIECVEELKASLNPIFVDNREALEQTEIYIF